jgi:hypothetical protein
MEALKYDAIFIQLGPFQILMLFFKADGKIISGSRAPPYTYRKWNISSRIFNCDFLNGTNFHRNKGIQMMLAVAIETLPFES